MNINLAKTVFAISTAPGLGAIAIIRISGNSSHQVALSIFSPSKKTKNIPEHSRLYYGKISDEQGIIDYSMCAFFYAPLTYTGEDMVEIHCHGSVYIQNRISQLLSNKGLIPAEHGEFSLRAFLNGKMDLVQAEGVNDLINSQNNFSHNQAVNQMRGHFSLKIQNLRKEIISLLSLFELELDFAEEDVEFADREKLLSACQALKDETDKLAESFKLGNVIKSGIPVAIIGEPNVGKSTLLNQLLGEERSIVCDIPGTTRDSIEDTLNIDKYTFRFIDTAGIRNTDDIVENIGVNRTYQKTSSAQIILLLLDIENASETYIHKKLEELNSHIPNLKEKKIIAIINKIDLQANEATKKINNYESIYISAKECRNIDILKRALVNYAQSELDKYEFILNNARHYNSLTAASISLTESIDHIKRNMPNDLTSSFLREAMMHIGNITGKIDNDDILDSIFKNFCIGK